jgi:hypothetical protein
VIGSYAGHRMRNRSECVKFHPFAVTLDQKASGPFNILLAGRLIDSPQRKPRHMRQVMMNQMIVVVQNQLRIAQSLSGWDRRLIAE